MIKAENLTKTFDGRPAVTEFSCTVPEGSIYGVVGANGAGKSTFLRLIAGIYKPDSGSVTIDGAEVYENPEAKSKIFYVSDELYFLPGADLERMGKLCLSTRGSFDFGLLKKHAGRLGLKTNVPISRFSKGMKRQAAVILALSCRPEIILFDETFDGLDPIVRNVVRDMIVDDVMERKLTVIMTTHSLRELEDTCDQLALLHEGGLVFQKEVDSLKTSLTKLQFAKSGEYSREDIEKAVGSNAVSFEKTGSVATVILRGQTEEIEEKLRTLGPSILEAVPLTLDEVFMYELAERGYSADGLMIGKDEEQ